MTKHAQICADIRDWFGDTSRTQRETKDGLEEIAELAQELADAIEPEEDEE